MGSLPERAYNIGETVARLEGAYLACRHAYLLHHQSDSALNGVGIGYGEGYSLAALPYPDNHEMAGAAGFGNHGSFHLKFYHIFREMLFLKYLRHNDRCSLWQR